MDNLDKIAKFVVQLVELYKIDSAFIYLIGKYGVRSSLFIEDTIKSGDINMIKMPLSEAIELRMSGISVGAETIAFDLNNHGAFFLKIEDLTINEFKKGMLRYSKEGIKQFLDLYVRKLKFLEEVLDLSTYEKE
jgi:hypothetical protein